MEISLGSKLYTRNLNTTRAKGEPDYEVFTVVGESLQSWLLSSKYTPQEFAKMSGPDNKMPFAYKIAKRHEGLCRFALGSKAGREGRSFYLTLQALQDSIWINQHRCQLAYAVQHLNDVDKLRAIAAIIGPMESVDKPA